MQNLARFAKISKTRLCELFAKNIHKVTYHLLPAGVVVVLHRTKVLVAKVLHIVALSVLVSHLKLPIKSRWCNLRSVIHALTVLP